MRFGHFFYPMQFDDSNDGQAIQDCLDEAVLAEELGYDAIWLAEHYFTGECIYGDPLVFASAIAVKTKHIEIGFGILELPLHNPVRVAVQTALLARQPLPGPTDSRDRPWLQLQCLRVHRLRFQSRPGHRAPG